MRPLYLADLGLPDQLWASMGIAAGTVFTAASIVAVMQKGPSRREGPFAI